MTAFQIMLIFPYVILGALANRHRGGWIGTGHTQLARLHFALSIAGMYFLGTADWIGAGVMVPLLFLGCLAGQGNDQADDTPMKVLGLMGSGLCNMLGLIAVAYISRHGGLDYAWSYKPDWQLLALLLAVVGKPIAYALGRVLPPWNTIPLSKDGWARGQTEWGEVLFGVFEGLTVWVTVQ